MRDPELLLRELRDLELLELAELRELLLDRFFFFFLLFRDFFFFFLSSGFLDDPPGLSAIACNCCTAASKAFRLDASGAAP